MEVADRDKYVIREMPMKTVIGKETLKRLQEEFCALENIFAFAMDEDGKMLTEMSGAKEEVSIIYEKVGMDTFYNAYKRVTSNALEEQIVERTTYENVRIAAISVRVDGVPYLNWLLCAVLPARDETDGGNVLRGISTIIAENRFLQVVDMVREVTNQIITRKFQYEIANNEAMQIKNSQESMGVNLKRVEAMTQIVQMLDSESTMEEVTRDVLTSVVNYMDISSAQVFRLSGNGTTVDLLSEVCNQGIVSCFDQTKNLTRPSILKHDKTYVISTDGNILPEERDILKERHILSFAAIPILINQKIAMYATFNECKKHRSFTVDEIKFMNDAVKVIQSVMWKRIQKNSLMSAYSSLEAILDNIGAAVVVEDERNGKILFSNKLMKSVFAEELNAGTIKKLLVESRPIDSLQNHHELYYRATNQWFDVHITGIKWVDARPATLYTAYDITDKKIYQRKIEQLAYTDFLTGLFNRMCCERDLACHIDEAKNEKRTGALLYLDLDDFKHINDGLGHQYGDALLKAIAHSVQRIEGIQKTCYRMGGDEFVIIIPPSAFLRASLIIDEIKHIFEKPWFLKDSDYYCTMSMGVVEFPTAGDNVQDLIKKADIAMYEAKKAGKNCVAEYTNRINSTSYKRWDMEKSMREATAQGYKEFEVFYQPIIDISRENTPCTGAEALIRWNSQELGFIPPSDFIPLAEYLGLINPIGNYVLQEACKTCKYWNDNGKPNFKVNVNLSVVQLLQNDIAETVEKVIIETGINPRNLTLEVTESLAINDMERMKDILYRIKLLGVRIALDDFGTGYSSLNHIREIPFDVIKVDQSFVTDLAEDAYSQSFVKMVGELASTLGVSLCVEGIETKEQYKVLEGMQVRMVQGYYFDRPITKEKFNEKYVL